MKEKALGIVGLVAAMAAGTTWAHEGNAVGFQGDNEAKNVCLSIIQDDTAQLKAALRWDRLKSRQLGDNQDNFRCNDMPLLEFANDVGAYNVSKYLDRHNRGRVDMEEVASR